VFKSTERITLLAAISRAGGLTDRAAKEDPHQSGRRRRPSRRRKIEADYKPSWPARRPDVELRQGDVIVIKGVVLLKSPLLKTPSPSRRANPFPTSPSPISTSPNPGGGAPPLEAGHRPAWRGRRGGRHYSVTPKNVHGDVADPDRAPEPGAGALEQAPWLDSYFDMEYYPPSTSCWRAAPGGAVVKSLDLTEDPAWNPSRGGGAGRQAGPLRRGRPGDLGILAEQLRGGLGVEPVSNTSCRDLLPFQDSSSPPGRQRLRRVVHRHGNREPLHLGGEGLDLLSTQIETLKHEIDDKEAKLQAFSRGRTSSPWSPARTSPCSAWRP